MIALGHGAMQVEHHSAIFLLVGQTWISQTDSHDIRVFQKILSHSMVRTIATIHDILQKSSTEIGSKAAMKHSAFSETNADR